MSIGLSMFQCFFSLWVLTKSESRVMILPVKYILGIDVSCPFRAALLLVIVCMLLQFCVCGVGWGWGCLVLIFNAISIYHYLMWQSFRFGRGWLFCFGFFSFWCFFVFWRLVLKVPWVGLWSVSMVFPEHNHFIFLPFSWYAFSINLI